MISKIKSHLQEIRLSYSQHLAFALKLAVGGLIITFSAIIHGLVPSIFTNTASNKIKYLSQLISRSSR